MKAADKFSWLCADRCDIMSLQGYACPLPERRMMMQKHAALYCRLSVDDGSFGGSVSIETQKILLEQYCQSHDITSYEFYCDVYNQRLIPFDTKMAVKMIK